MFKKQIKYIIVIYLVWCATAVDAQTQSKPETLVFEVEGVKFEMILVEGGKFMRGGEPNDDLDCYDNESPVHRVTLSDFYIGKVEVTQKLWHAVMHYNPSHYQDDEHPVENISWNECQEFIARLNRLLNTTFRLPSEAEWEYAARGGKYSNGYKYSGSNNLDDVAWYDNTTKDKGHHSPVGTKESNELGLYDMSGNVWEWCQDWYDVYEKYPLTNPIKENGFFKVLRGGCSRGVARSCRVTNRSSKLPELKGFYYGFRLATY